MRVLTLSLALAAITGACAGAGTTDPTSSAVHNPIEASASLQFSPQETTIALGDSVTFVISSVPHSVEFQKGEELKAYYGGTSSAGAPANVPVGSNQRVVRTFSTRGSFRYHCGVHAGMQGEITVQ